MDTRPDARVTDTVDAAFIELICNDADLLAAEFDAIIAAEWPTPPNDHPIIGDDCPGGHPGPGQRPATYGAHDRAPQYVEVGAWTRERSPPKRSQIAHRQEGR
jgi:hypothetical protein